MTLWLAGLIGAGAICIVVGQLAALAFDEQRRIAPWMRALLMVATLLALVFAPVSCALAPHGARG
jgi:hypothetical protein